MNRISMIILGVLAISAIAEAGPATRTGATDLIVLSNGWRLKGIVLTTTADPQTISVLVRTAWLTTSLPDLPSADPSDEHPAAAAASQIRLEIDRLKAADERNDARIGFLETRAAELVFFAGKPKEQPHIAILRIPNPLIRRIQKPSQAARVVGFYGILNDIDRTEELSQKRLRRKLEALPPESLETQLPNTGSLTEDGLVQNVLLNADSQLASACQLIRIGDTVFDASDDRQATELAMSILTEQLRNQLLAFDSSVSDSATDRRLVTLPPSAIDIAKQKSAAMVEVAEVRLDVASGTASVRLTLFHRDHTIPLNELGSKDFRRIGSVAATATTSDLPPERAEAIAADPRIKQAISLFRALGSGQRNVTTAVNMGAIVEAAQQDAQRQQQDLIPPLLDILNQSQVLEITIDELPEK